MKFDWILIVACITTILQAVASGTIHLTDMVPDQYLKKITAWAGFFAFCNSTFLTVVVGIKTNAATAMGETIMRYASAALRLIIVLLLAVFVFLAPAARAADMPLAVPDTPVYTKAVPKRLTLASTPCTVLSCSGFYGGVTVLGSGSNLDIIGGGINNSVLAGGATAGVDAGYQLWNGQWFADIEAFIGYTLNANNNQVTAPANANHWAAYQVVDVGYGLSNLFGTNGNAPSPSQGPVTIPTALASTLISPFISFGACERPWGTAWCTGAGAAFVLAPQWELKIRYLYANYSNAQVNLNTTQQSDNYVGVSANYKF
jgi:opacity protein-like surface antigen